ncbi:MAG: hypothetical protein AAF986_08045 [Pseudomonadota bacterium]
MKIKLFFSVVLGLAACGEETSEGDIPTTVQAPPSNNVVLYVEPKEAPSTSVSQVSSPRPTRFRVDDAVNSLAFADAAGALITTMNRQTLILDLETGEERKRVNHCAHCDTVFVRSVDGGRHFVMPGNAKKPGIKYDATSGEPIGEVLSFGRRSAVSPDGARRLVVRDREAVLEDAQTQEILWRSGLSRVMALAIAPDGGHFVISTDRQDKTLKGGELRIFNAATYEVEAEILFERGSFNHLAFSPDSTRLVMGSYKDRVVVWDVEQHTVHCRFNSHERGMRALRMSPDGAFVATGGGDDWAGYGRVWSTETCNMLGEVTFSERVAGLDFHPNSDRVAMGAWSGEVAVLSLREAE